VSSWCYGANNNRKGKWWTGNTVIHHYVPNTILKKENFNETYQRVQVRRRFKEVGKETLKKTTDGYIPIRRGSAGE
jgi:hypothetical protein